MDKIDTQILNEVDEKSGEQISKILRSLDCRTASILRKRLGDLELKGYVFLDRTSFRGQVLVSITPLGKEKLAVMGREESTPATETTP